LAEKAAVETETLGTQMFANGQIWKTPMCHMAITQWIGNDQWMLLGVPQPSRFGGTCMVPYTQESGRVIYSTAELEERLKKNKWERCPSAQVELES